MTEEGDRWKLQVIGLKLLSLTLILVNIMIDKDTFILIDVQSFWFILITYNVTL